MEKVLFPGSFDPIQYGHINIIKRILNKKLADKVVVGIGWNPEKLDYIFNVEEREEMIRDSLSAYPELEGKVEVASYKGLLVDYAYENKLPVIRGVRDDKDFYEEKEMHYAGETQKLGVETLLIFSSPDKTNIRSSSIKALRKEQGSIHDLVPLNVKQRLETRLLGQHIIGVTGEIGTGKSTISNKLEELGKKRGIPVYHIDLDKIPHEIYDGTLKQAEYVEIRKKVIETFGEKVGYSNGTVNRKALGEIVFGDFEKLEKLNQIVRKPVEVISRRKMRGKDGLFLIDAALIPETGMNYLSNNNIFLIIADKSSQERRLRERNLTEEQIKRRLAGQYTTDQKREKINKTISEHQHGRIWEFDNSDGSDQSKLNSIFNDMIKYIDKDGQLRFMGLWTRIGADGSYDKEYKTLRKIYLHPLRHHHSLPHIVNGLDEIEDARHLMENSDQVEFAWWYHDSVIDMRSKVDEDRSAEKAFAVCKKTLLPDNFANNVKSLILTTKHREHPSKNDEKFIADIDLSIFGKSSEEFDRYEENIRKEYEWVDTEVFRVGRSNVLKRFLSRRSIYHTDFFREKYEERAERNLENSLKKLKL